MTNEEMERAIEFLLKHQAQLSADISKLTAAIETMREETRYGFEKLIQANGVTRRLTEEVAQPAVQTSRRVSDLESNQ